MTEPFRADRGTRCALHREGARVRLVGDVDLGNWADVSTALGAGVRTLDLTGVRYFGAAGVRVVLDAYAARPFGATFQVTCAPSVFRVLRISGVYDSEELVVSEAAMTSRSSAGAGE